MWAARPSQPLFEAERGERRADVVVDLDLVARAVEAAQQAALAGRPVAGLSVASIGESFVLVGENGRPLAPAIAWYDRRTEPVSRDLGARLGEERIFALTGHGPEPIFSLMKLLWMRAHWPEAVAGARRVLMFADWIAWRPW